MASLRTTSIPTAALFLIAGCAVPAPRALPGKLPHYRDGARFATVGDLQRTTPLEFFRESNDPEREILVGAIAAAKPAFLAITGDLVDIGGSPSAWRDFDDLMTPVRDAEIPVFAAFGNHEYWGGHTVEALFFARFPHQSHAHWLSFRFGPLRLVVLDSNREDLTSAEWSRQSDWYVRTLDNADADPSVRGVVVLFHHAPYSNSTVTGDDTDTQEAFVPPFMRSRKARLIETGHVHNYERFDRSGKTFLVSGGGGGPRARLLEGDARRHPDDLVIGPPVRDFHFTLFTVTSRGLNAEVVGVAKGASATRPIDHFRVDFAD